MTRLSRNAGASSFGFERSGLPVVDTVVAVARRLWPIKTARHLAARAGVTHRAGEFWLSQQTGMSADALAELLRSDAGFDVLEGLMGQTRPDWWPRFKDGCRLDDVERRLDDLKSELEGLRK